MLVVYAGILAFGLNEFRKTPIGFIPQLDRGYLIVVIQLPPGASLVAHRRGQPARRRARDAGPRRRGRGEHRRLLRRDLHQCAECRRDLRRARSVRGARRRPEEVAPMPSSVSFTPSFAAIQEALILVVPPPPVQGIGNAGGFRMMIEDRAGRGSEALLEAVNAVMARARRAPELTQVFSLFEISTPQLYLDIDRTKAQTARHQRLRRVRRAADLYRLALRQRLQPVRPHLPRHRAGGRRRFGTSPRTCSSSACAIRAATRCRSPRSPR